MPSNLNLRQFLQRLRKSGEIADIHHEVDPHLEIAEIHRRVAAADGPALFFHRVKNSPFPVVTNLFGSKQRIELAFPNHPEKVIAELIQMATKDFPPKLSHLWEKRALLKNLLHLGTKRNSNGPVKERCLNPPDLEKLPMLKTWPMDGGHFITLPLVYTEPPEGGPPNLGMYRIQRYNKRETGLHFQIQKGGGFHYHMAESRNVPLPVTIFIGGPPALILSAITPLPENVPELLISGLMQGKKLDLCSSAHTPHPLIAECEFALVGKARPQVRRLEGPFGDHYGYYSWEHEFPVFECDALYHRKGAIYPATVVGKPRQEDFYIGDYLQQLLSPLFPVVMPGVRDLWSYGETGFHSLSAAVVRERYYRECMASAFRILGEGQLSLTKFLLLTDQSVDLRNFRKLLKTVLERFSPETDLFVFSNLSLDTLDYTGPELNKGSRGVMLGIGEKKRDLPNSYRGGEPPGIKKIAPYSAGCLVIEGAFNQNLLDFEGFKEWPLIVVVDSVEKALKNDAAFLWTVFTRFEPAADLHAKKRIVRNHISFLGPLFIDARMKEGYPPEVLCDSETAALVTQNWNRYFPEGMEMGESETAHV
ncbi:MAG: UbiD family decarboxylase [Chlamydiales bacterium]|nr:UbiD family decarboxylase [Chlamydiales bacterium]